MIALSFNGAAPAVGRLAAQDRFRMLLQVVGEHAQRARGTLQLEQRLFEVALHRRIRIGDVLVEVLERCLRALQRALHFGKRLLRFRRELADRLARACSVVRRSLADLVERDLADLRDDLGDLRLHFAQRARSGGQVHRAVGIHRHAHGPLADEAEGDVELAGEQVAGSHLRAHAVGDELLQHHRFGHAAARSARRLQQRVAQRAEPKRVDVGQHLDREALVRAVVLQRDRGDVADLDTQQVDGGAVAQPAHRLVEDHAHVHRRSVGRRECAASIAVQREDGIGRCRQAGADAGRRLESEAARQHRRQRLRVQGQAAGVQVRSIPLAFQNRVAVVTSFWNGASMKILIESSSLSGSSV